MDTRKDEAGRGPKLTAGQEGRILRKQLQDFASSAKKN